MKTSLCNVVILKVFNSFCNLAGMKSFKSYESIIQLKCYCFTYITFVTAHQHLVITTRPVTNKEEKVFAVSISFWGFNLSDVLSNFVFRVFVTKQSMVKWIIFNDIIFVLENNGKVGNAIRANV